MILLIKYEMISNQLIGELTDRFNSFRDFKWIFSLVQERWTTVNIFIKKNSLPTSMDWSRICRLYICNIILDNNISLLNWGLTWRDGMLRRSLCVCLRDWQRGEEKVKDELLHAVFLEAIKHSFGCQPYEWSVALNIFSVLYLTFVSQTLTCTFPDTKCSAQPQNCHVLPLPYILNGHCVWHSPH